MNPPAPAGQQDMANTRTRSADGTEIGFDRQGSGPALIMVDPAGGYSGFDQLHGLAARLADHFTVIRYDRRGRGRSQDTPPYAVAKEIEDLTAMVDEAGGSASVYGLSSGGLLALHAATEGVPITSLVLFEPPVRAEGEPPDTRFTNEIKALVAEGRRQEAVTHFLTGIGVPPEYLGPVPPAFEAVAHTLAYDCEISNATTFDLLRRVETRTLILDSQGSSEDLTGGAGAIAEALPKGTLHSLQGGWHGAPDEDIAEAVIDYLTR